MPSRLIFVRHGLTIWNYEFRYQGHTDIELSEEGIAQAQALQKRLSTEKPSAIYSSDLRRAWQTAQIIAEAFGLPVNLLPELREINFGVWEGLTYRDLEKNYPELLKTWLETPDQLVIPGGETFAMVQERALKAVKDIAQQYPDDTVIIVTHGGTIAAIICGLQGEHLSSMWKYKHGNTAVTILRVDKNRTVVEILNDTSHLV
ncbi:MAG: pspA 1 [Peptococcaceae bacterium]|jgi:alpha-ribazole phosphatase|nr:pspA 1 [Peptococcaceae bacterium]